MIRFLVGANPVFAPTSETSWINRGAMDALHPGSWGGHSGPPQRLERSILHGATEFLADGLGYGPGQARPLHRGWHAHWRATTQARQ